MICNVWLCTIVCRSWHFLSDKLMYTMAYEAKQYAQRNRQGSDWFSHDGGAVSARPVCPAPTELVPEAMEPPPVGEEDVVDKSPIVESAPAAVQSARAQMIKPKCDSNEWLVLLSLLLLL